MSNSKSAFPKGKPFFIMYPINDEQTKKAVAERRAILLKNSRIRYDRTDDYLQSHITIFNFQINSDHPNSKIFETAEFRNIIRNAFDRYLNNERIIHTRNDYKILSNFYGKEYTLENSDRITDFRIFIYQFIEYRLGRYTFVSKDGFIILKVNGQDLIAINDYNWGRGNWLSHISILQFRNDPFRSLSLFHCNKDLYNLIHYEYQNKNHANVKQEFNRCITTQQTNLLTIQNEINRNGKQRLKVMPFQDLYLNSSEPLMISMKRGDPRQNWQI